VVLSGPLCSLPYRGNGPHASYNRAVRWTVLVPVKSLPEAKSRLAGASADADAHRRLVRAIRADTLAAVRPAAGVARLVLVLDRPGPAIGADGSELTYVQSVPGLNAALSEAAANTLTRWPDDAIAALVGDLPALRPEELADALARAARLRRAFVADAAGTGTTLLTATPGNPLAPRFGVGSAARHASGATALEAGPGLRCDVDTDEDLRAAMALGMGPHTAGVLACPPR
jgi:2-phospho-L-lactate guanylyltransferase